MPLPLKKFFKCVLPNVAQRTITGIIFAAIFWAVYLMPNHWYFTALLAGIFMIVIVDEWKHFYSPKSRTFWLMLPLYPGLPFTLLIALSIIPAYRPLLLVLFVLAFANDTGAYIIGNIMGRHFILPQISPKKTWEGFVGGYVSALTAFLIINSQYHWRHTLVFSALFTLAMSSLFLLGDLFESRLKRKAGIKDSGSLLPGHGGFLDRFDGVLFATLLCYILRAYLFK